jgi:hypothetical protein
VLELVPASNEDSGAPKLGRPSIEIFDLVSFLPWWPSAVSLSLTMALVLFDALERRAGDEEPEFDCDCECDVCPLECGDCSGWLL